MIWYDWLILILPVCFAMAMGFSRGGVDAPPRGAAAEVRRKIAKHRTDSG